MFFWGGNLKTIIIFLTILFTYSLISQYPLSKKSKQKEIHFFNNYPLLDSVEKYNNPELLKHKDIRDVRVPKFFYILRDTIDGSKLIFPDSLKHLQKHYNKYFSKEYKDSIIKKLNIHFMEKNYFLIDSVVKLEYD